MFFKSLFKILFLLSVLILFVFTFAACDALRSDSETTDKDSSDETVLIVSTTAQLDKTETQTTAKAEKLKDTFVIFDDENTIINGEGAVFSGGVLTVTQGGTYSIKGKLSDGKIYVNTSDNESKKVKLIFDGADISCSTDAPLFIENSPRETVIILSEGSVNNISDTARSYPRDESEEYATAAIYSKDDLQIEGVGTLNLQGNFSKGIFSKNDIDIRGGVINITALDDGIRGKDSVEISDGSLSIKCGGDGIRTSEIDEENKGNILISGGNMKIESDLDGIQSVKSAEITGGKIEIISGGGATGEIQNESFAPGRPEGGMYQGGNRKPMSKPNNFSFGPSVNDSSAFEEESEDTPSTKGIKADENLSISGGEIKISSLDDSVHAVNVKLTGGEFTLESDDDGIHADEQIEIDEAKINITNSYEGIEGKTIEIDSGEVLIRSADDGFNAVSDSETMGRPDMSDETCFIEVKDGYIFINADGDGVDSNGSVTMHEGTLIVFGPEGGGNSALDYGGTFKVEGGTLLALGSAGMAQSVTAGEDVSVLAFNFTQSADTLTAITDSEGDMCIAFTSDKSFATVVYASEDIHEDESYQVYMEGVISGHTQNGVCLEGIYTPGEYLGSLDKSA